jgi:hypothetical protein
MRNPAELEASPLKLQPKCASRLEEESFKIGLSEFMPMNVTP